jgi:lysophospholipase L1-like esterase
MAHRTTRGKTILFWGAMIALTIGVCFCLVEFVFARFYYSDVHLVSDTVFDPTLGWLLRPGTFKTKAPNRFRKHTIHINVLGLRNRELDTSGTGGAERIVILGDSFTYGKAIGEERLFSRRIERSLNGGARPERYEVVNAGVPGYGSAQEMLLMRRLAREGVRGELYLVVMFVNDILDNLCLTYSDLADNPAQPCFGLGPDGSLVLEHPPEMRFAEESEDFVEAAPSLDRMKIGPVLRLRIESFLQTRPSLIRALARIGLSVKFPAMPGVLNAWYREEIVERGTPLLRALLTEMRDEARRQNGTLLVTLIPSQIQVYPETYGPLLARTFPDCAPVRRWLADGERPQRATASLCAELGIPFLDLLPALRRHAGRVLYIPREGHLSEEGHSIVAENLVSFLEDHMVHGTSSSGATNDGAREGQ